MKNILSCPYLYLDPFHLLPDLCCSRCDSENRYLGNPLRGTCYCKSPSNSTPESKSQTPYRQSFTFFYDYDLICLKIRSLNNHFHLQSNNWIVETIIELFLNENPVLFSSQWRILSFSPVYFKSLSVTHQLILLMSPLSSEMWTWHLSLTVTYSWLPLKICNTLTILIGQWLVKLDC